VPERYVDAIPDLVSWKNISPRLGVSFDLFGTDRTAITVIRHRIRRHV